MSNEENAKKSVDAAKETAGKLFSLMMDLKEKNPKVFFGAIGGIVVLLIIIMMSGGDSGVIPKTCNQKSCFWAAVCFEKPQYLRS